MIFYHISSQIYFSVWSCDKFCYFSVMEVHIHVHREAAHLPCHANVVLYFNSDTCRGSLTSSSLQPEQFKPSTQTAVTDPINHLVEAEFCMISPCGDPKIFHGGVSFPYKKSCYMILCCSFLLFIFCSSVLFIIHC